MSDKANDMSSDMSNERPQQILVCDKISKSFDEGELHVDVLNSVSFSVAKGEMVAIVGASGSGKSTLLQLLGGLDKPNAGKVLINGHNISDAKEAKKSQLRNRYMGFVYQFHHLLPEFDALENVCMPLLIRGDSAKQAKALALDMINKVGLSERAEHRIGELSGGERQRIAIARALVTNPECVLADEPTGNLDRQTASQVFDIMLKLNVEMKTSFVIVTHDETIAKQMHRRLTLTDGHLNDVDAK